MIETKRGIAIATRGMVLLMIITIFVSAACAVLASSPPLEVAYAWSGSVTITINSDGTVDPATAPIRRSGNRYTLLEDVHSDLGVNAIVIKRDGIMLDGKGHMLQGQGTGYLDSAIGVYLNDTVHVTVRNLQIQGYFYGVRFQTSSYNTLQHNQIVSNQEAVFFAGIGESYFNRIVHNTISNNRVGITNNDYNTYVSYSTIAHNNFKNNEIAIILNGFRNEADFNTIEHNVITNNIDGIILQIDPTNNVISNNFIASNSGNGIEILDCSGNTIKNNLVIANGGTGIRLGSASDNKILKNVIINNINGTVLDSGEDTQYLGPSRNNQIIGNTIGWNTQLDLCFLQSPNNLIYHNNLFGNPVQVLNVDSANTWDNGYPSGGNYWSSYISVDYYRGPNQDQPGRDRIWDAPLIIDSANTDNYPLTHFI